jgi:hypothetical protein
LTFVDKTADDSIKALCASPLDDFVPEVLLAASLHAAAIKKSGKHKIAMWPF